MLCSCRLAVARLTLILLGLGLGRAHANHLQPNEKLDERNRRETAAIADLFLEAKSSPTATTVSHNKYGPTPELNSNGATRKSLLRMLIGDPEILQDIADNDLVDPESNAPHVRVKRMANLRRISTLQATGTHSNEKTLLLSPSPYMDKKFLKDGRSEGASSSRANALRRFSADDKNPADENEAEYSSNAFEEDVDVPGAFLDDEPSKKRNNLEDVYPEVTDDIRPKAKERLLLESANYSNAFGGDTLRIKRDEEEEADCIDESEDCYDEDEEELELSNGPRDELRRSKDNENQQGDGQSNRANDLILPESNKNSNQRQQDRDHHQHIARLSSSSSSSLKDNTRIEHSSVGTSRAMKEKKKLNESKGEKEKKIKSRDEEKAKSERKLTKEKTKTKPTLKSTSRKKLQKPGKSHKGVASKLSSSSSDRLKQHARGKAEGSRETIRAQSKMSAASECAECKGKKNVVVKAILPDVKQKAAAAAAEEAGDSKLQDAAVKNAAAQSIGQLQDLMAKLIVKVVDLHSLLAEFKSNPDNRLGLHEQKMTRSNFPVDSQRWSPWTRWSDCSVSCGSGTHTRSRRCLAGCQELSLAQNEEGTCTFPDCPPAKFLGIF